MIIPVTSEFQSVCSSIAAEQKSLNEWRAIESDDMYQTDRFCGGFDATEDAFCFSYYDETNKEFWFQITLDEAAAIASRKTDTIIVRAADTF